VLIEHQLSSFDNLITDTIPRMVQQQSPIEVNSGDNLKYKLQFLRIYINKPVQHDPDTGYQPLYPNEARIRDLTYSAPIFVDYCQTCTTHGTVQTQIVRKVPLWKMPIMLGSKYCHLYGKSVPERAALNECKMDRGGYFIINGSEKVVIAQERPVDNRIMIFKGSSEAKFVARSEIKSTID